MPQNPVTFRGTVQRWSGKPMGLTIGRLWIGTADYGWDKSLPVVLFEETDDPEKPKILGTVVLDENHFLEGLKLLFPNGELAKL